MCGDTVTPAERLIATATELFYRKGFRAVGVEELVEQAGVSKPTLYRHFASKDALAAACLGRLAAQDLQCLSAIAARLPGDPVGQIEAIVMETAGRIGDAAYRGWPMSNVEVEEPDRLHPARQVCAQYKAGVRAHLDALCQAAEFARPSALADGLLLLIEGAAASWHGFGPNGPAAQLSASCAVLMAGHWRRGAF